jgi:hypothetical protein
MDHRANVFPKCSLCLVDTNWVPVNAGRDPVRPTSRPEKPERSVA